MRKALPGWSESRGDHPGPRFCRLDRAPPREGEGSRPSRTGCGTLPSPRPWAWAAGIYGRRSGVAGTGICL